MLSFNSKIWYVGTSPKQTIILGFNKFIKLIIKGLQIFISSLLGYLLPGGRQGILFISSPPKDHIAPATSNRTIAFFLSKILLFADSKKPQFPGAFYY